jgi:hypothetical protein
MKDGSKDSTRKLTLSKETLRTLDERDLSQIVGGANSGGNTPPRKNCPASKSPSCDCGPTG